MIASEILFVAHLLGRDPRGSKSPGPVKLLALYRAQIQACTQMDIESLSSLCNGKERRKKEQSSELTLAISYTQIIK